MTPNGLRISRAATVDREGKLEDRDAKIGPILWPRSGVGLHVCVGWRNEWFCLRK